MNSETLNNQSNKSQIQQSPSSCHGFKLFIKENDQEVGRAFLYIMANDLHNQPFGLLEDVYIDESQRGKGLGTSLVQEVITLAQQHHCYKLIATSRYARPRVHELYLRLGFEDWGKEFRMNF